VVRFGLSHPRTWAILPLALLAVGVLGLGQLANHYSWGDGTTLLIGVLTLCLFVVTVGPLTLLPRTLVRQARGETSTAPITGLMEALRRSVTEAGETRAKEYEGSVSTRSRTRRPR
jgi:hypothetical protein